MTPKNDAADAAADNALPRGASASGPHVSTSRHVPSRHVVDGGVTYILGKPLASCGVVDVERMDATDGRC